MEESESGAEKRHSERGQEVWGEVQGGGPEQISDCAGCTLHSRQGWHHSVAQSVTCTGGTLPQVGWREWRGPQGKRAEAKSTRVWGEKWKNVMWSGKKQLTLNIIQLSSVDKLYSNYLSFQYEIKKSHQPFVSSEGQQHVPLFIMAGDKHEHSWLMIAH